MEFDTGMSPATAAVIAIQSGDISSLHRLLARNPSLVKERVDGQRTLLHIATDWPGHFPNNRDTVIELITRGADVSAGFVGPHSETPLHWAASTDDVEVLDVLLDFGANIEAPGGVIGGGTSLEDAVAFGQWRAARRLVERGAIPSLWAAAALGLIQSLEQSFANMPYPSKTEVTNAFWCACHGGEAPAAEYLLNRGADLNWVGHDGLTPVDAANRAGSESLVRWLRTLGAKSATELA